MARLLKGLWLVVTGVCRALVLVVSVLCAMIEAMAFIFLLGSRGGNR